MARDLCSSLIARARRGERITLIDKIEDETCLAVLDAMQKSCGARGRELTMDELTAFARRRAELQRSVRRVR